MTTVREGTIQETANGLAYLIKALVNWSDIVTAKHIENRGGKTWDINSQLTHAHSEISEIFQAIRHNEGLDRVFEENIDALLSTVTNLTIVRLNMALTKEQLNAYIDLVSVSITKKLYSRIGISLE